MPAVGVYVPEEVKICIPIEVIAEVGVNCAVPPAPKLTDEPSVPVNVKVLSTVKVLPSAIVTVLPVTGGVKVILLSVVTVATPNAGVIKVGELAPTKAPDPVTPESPLFKILIVDIIITYTYVKDAEGAIATQVVLATVQRSWT